MVTLVTRVTTVKGLTTTHQIYSTTTFTMIRKKKKSFFHSSKLTLLRKLHLVPLYIGVFFYSLSLSSRRFTVISYYPCVSSVFYPVKGGPCLDAGSQLFLWLSKSCVLVWIVVSRMTKRQPCFDGARTIPDATALASRRLLVKDMWPSHSLVLGRVHTSTWPVTAAHASFNQTPLTND